MVITTLKTANATQTPTAIGPQRSVGDAPTSREEVARRAFDGYFFQAALEQAFPKKSGAVFGRGFSGDVMRSMLAERVAAEIAKRSDFSLTGKALDGFNPHRKEAAAVVGIQSTSGLAVTGGEIE